LTAVQPWVWNWAAPDVPLRVSPHLDPACEHRSFVSRSDHPRIGVGFNLSGPFYLLFSSSN
jgi:hypothetical protein